MRAGVDSQIVTDVDEIPIAWSVTSRLIRLGSMEKVEMQGQDHQQQREGEGEGEAESNQPQKQTRTRGQGQRRQNPDHEATTTDTVARTANRKPTIPLRQIRAHYDTDTITVYQAYSAAIAEPAVQQQLLSASPSFKFTRMTWIKPSWTWMMYRCGYTTKDARQTHVLAIKMRHEHFRDLLRLAGLAEHGSSRNVEGPQVIVQWDPERGVMNDRLDFRSIQIGISKEVSEKWVKEWIVSIEDVSERARSLKKRLDQEGLERGNKGGQSSLSRRVLEQEGLLPVERVYDVPDDIRVRLGMDVDVDVALSAEVG